MIEYMTTEPQCTDSCDTCCKRRKIKMLHYDIDENGELVSLPDTLEWTCPIKEERQIREQYERMNRNKRRR